MWWRGAAAQTPYTQATNHTPKQRITQPTPPPLAGLTAAHVRAKVGQLLNMDLGGRDMHPIVNQSAALQADVDAIASEEHLAAKLDTVVGLLFDTHKGSLEEVTRWQRA